MRSLMPSLCCIFRFHITTTADQYIIGIKVRHTASSDRLTTNEDVEFETRVLMIIMSRSLQKRHILEQQYRIFDSIYIERELNTFRLVIRVPVT